MLDRQDAWERQGDVAQGLRDMAKAANITQEARRWVGMLVDEYEAHLPHNNMLRDYYDGRVSVSDYGVTADISNDQTCHWPQKAVSALADRIRLKALAVDEGHGDVDAGGAAGTYADVLARVERANSFVVNYNRHVPAKLLYGCMAATVNRSRSGRATIRFHSAETFTALPSPDHVDGVVAGGLAVARREVTPWSNGRAVPTIVNLHTPYNTGEFRQVDAGRWVYEHGETPEGLPSLYVFAHDGAGTLAPFGRTRITRFVRTLTDDAIRCMWHMQVSGAFYSMAKLYMTGLTDEQFDAVMEDKSSYQLSRILAMTAGPEGGNPDVGQLSGNSPQPFIDELRALACQFSGATGVPLNSLGIVQDNPSSADAIQASREDVCLVAERDIESDKPTIGRVMRAAMAVELNTTADRIEDVDVMARFELPILYTLNAKADWAVKVNAVRPSFGATDAAALMMGVDEADLPKIKSDERRAQAVDAVSVLASGGVEPERRREQESLIQEGGDGQGVRGQV